ncbi:cytochrome c biogenesis CcdA family protein [Vulcanimicrobium alpinum]|uniref:cytochrome c biogenesis CcdA family protein n=1 Tax=Vulcanimicrobium alpinum TaxID=3016050 RepID=UPI00295F3A2B|nr:cytochrome c biogenesis protein CcdA [Vulcanimicrobium alpinum]
MNSVNILTAFLAGVVSFVSPCVLPLIPAYLSFLTGSSLEELKAQTDAGDRARVMIHALAFIGGFTLVFMALGFTASAVGTALIQYRDWVAKIGGVIVIVLGLNMIGVFKIPFLMMDKRPQFRSANRSYIASFLVGLGFAAGWSPCIGPILAGILLKASQEQFAEATVLLFFYSMGLGLPFFLTAALISRALGALNRVKRYLGAIEVGAGAFLVATGVVLVTGTFGRVAGFFYQYVKPPSL